MKKKVIKISLFCIAILSVIALTAFGIYKIMKHEVSAIQAVASRMNASTSGAGTLAPGEQDPNNYSYHTDTGIWEWVRDYGTNSFNIAYYPDFQIYCINPGSPIRYTYNISYDRAKELEEQMYTSFCKDRYGCADTPEEGKVTPPRFVPEGSYELPAAAAYIVSDEPIGEWSEEKQKAIWNLKGKKLHDGTDDQYEPEDGDIIIGDGHSNNEGSSIYDQEAEDYADYDSSVRDTGLNPEDKTNINYVYTKVNQDKKEYTVGPFNMEYTQGIYGNIAFAGVSEMKVIGYNSEKEEVNSNIAIKKIILKDEATKIYGNAVTPEYFEPSSELKVDETTQVYPACGQDFQIVFDDPNANLSNDDTNRVVYISIKVKFKYMLANGQYTKLRGTKYTVRYDHDHRYNYHMHSENHGRPDVEAGGIRSRYEDRECNGCKTTCFLEARQQQWLAAMDAIRSIYEQEINLGFDPDNPPGNPPGNSPDNPIGLKMDLGGHVWEDGVETKETKADGVSNTVGDNIDKPLKNVKVTLYTSDGEVATLLSNPNESGITDDQIMHRVNPTYTDTDGNYLFEGLDPMKKYYVQFEYNGQVYLPTEYLNTADKKYSSVQQIVNAGLYNSTEWQVTSKGTETVSDRNNYDKKFEEIGSYPENYQSSNSLGEIGSKNATFTQKDLMGYTLNREGKYEQSTTQLIDGYLYDADGNETTTYKEGVISQKVRQYIQSNKEFPNTNAMKSIYNSIANDDKETWRKLQFIEDCKIVSYTQPQGGNKDLYPVYTKFRINHKEAENGNYDMKVEVLDRVTYNPIYPGQFFVNQGLWRRQEFDAAIRKDVYRAVTKINNKTEMYTYDKRNDGDQYWDINVRMSNYDEYYGIGYNREIYRTDYVYSSKDLDHQEADLEIYVTYKITIRNQSQSIMTQIKEVVDYYDKDYTYRDDLSWVTYKNTVSDEEYYNAMVAEDVSKIANAESTQAESESRYGSSTHSDITKTYNAVYVKGLEEKKLATGESAYIYLTFQVNKQGGKVILDDASSPKMNYAEINGYKTYYKDGTSLPNDVTKNSNNIAGLIDRDSNPGNLVQSDINDKDRHEKNFEDDTDRAKALRITIYKDEHEDKDAVRKVNGTVWEDKRTDKSGDSIIGNGIRDDKEETKIAGVTVQLVEKTIDGKEYIWQETTTNKDGYYSFESYIPGDYVIRFYYGDKVATAKVNGKDGLNDTSYNGQDFKSTIYQKGITQSMYTDKSNRYPGYNRVLEQNGTGKYVEIGKRVNDSYTYGYNIYAADSKPNNVSDAKDLWEVGNVLNQINNNNIENEKVIHGRQSVINYSNEDVTNHKAEVLASPYETPTYNSKKYTTSEMDALINELISNTYMTAETGIIAVEFEYDRQKTDGLKNTENSGIVKNMNKNQLNGNYTLANIDLGLTERPKAQLEIDKSIANLKVTLANNSVLFDVNKAGDNVIWKDHTEYNLASKKDSQGKYEEYYGKDGKNRYSYREKVNDLVNKSDKGLIQLTMDEELMHGATIEITYKVKVTNVGEVDYKGQKYYYLGDSSGANVVTTMANQVVDYVANNLQFVANQKWAVIQNTALIPSQGADTATNLVNRRLDNQVKQYNNIIQTTDVLTKELRPGEATDEKALVLTQLISTENKSDDLTYKNMVEIVKTSNTVGRRMAYSVVGNQDPTATDASEVDSSMAEKVIILPPFGDTHIFYILGAVIAIILIGGIAFIIRKVVKK